MHDPGSIAESDRVERSMTRFLRPAVSMLSPQGRNGRLTILIFHRVRATQDELYPNEVHAASFLERMRIVQAWFNVIPLEEAVTRLASGALPARALSITFDDGYADNCTVALPILQQLGLHATFFVATGFLDGRRMWNDTVVEVLRRAGGSELDLSSIGLGTHPLDSSHRRRAAIDHILAQLKYLPPDRRRETADALATRSGVALPDDLMMSSDQLRSLACAGMGIGAHTVTHPILTRLDDASALREIADGRDQLEGIVRQPVGLFAYPNGKPDQDYAVVHVQMVAKLGFQAAFSTAWGAASGTDSRFELPRFTPWDPGALRFVGRLAANMTRKVRVAA